MEKSARALQRSDSASKSPKTGANWNAACCSTHGLGSVWTRAAMPESARAPDVCVHAAGPPGFWEKRGMRGLRCDHILASAAVALLLAAPLCALAQETAPAEAGITGSSKAGDAPAVPEASTFSATASTVCVAPKDGVAPATLSAPDETP